MGNSYKLDKGFLFDHSWEKQFRKLKPKDFCVLFWELYDFQQSGGTMPVSEHDDNVLMSSIVTFVVPQLRNRINGARRNSRTEAGGGAGGNPPPTPLKLSEVKLSEVKLNESENAPAREEDSKKPFGEYKNVLLSEKERGELDERYGKATAERLINVFSRKLKAKGYRYDDHFAAIVLWADEDGAAKSDGTAGGAELEAWFEKKLRDNFGD